MKVAGRLYAKGTPVAAATLAEVRKIWPAVMPNPESNQVAVVFPDMPWPTIVEKSQVEL
jgi:hypothetical protein